MLATACGLEPLTLSQTVDYDVVRRAITFIAENWRTQPEIDAVAYAAGVSSTELHHLFRRWAGITPKAFLQALTLDHARRLLRDSASVLDASYEVGLSGPGRLHDLFVTHEAMSPGEWKTGGDRLTIAYGFHPSPFGIALVMMTPRGLCGLAFSDPGGEPTALEDMRRRWPRAQYVEDESATGPVATRIFNPSCWRSDQPLRIVLIGSDFEVRVWETLLRIPLGGATAPSCWSSSTAGAGARTRRTTPCARPDARCLRPRCGRRNARTPSCAPRASMSACRPGQMGNSQIPRSGTSTSAPAAW
jgi:AraC family transcriptional regulator, regulatory protein of adaptative response / methylated-DNA-[protein]-cysteine methyltransferase